ncbi:hypothetical protein D9M68_513860 [compost metagenome]
MKRSSFRLLGGGLLLALVALGWLLYRNLEPYSETVEHGPSPEARANDYLAAESFLRRRGLQVSTARGLEVLDQLPSQGQTLILLGSRENVTPGQTDRLLAWADRGGHLIVIAERLWNDRQGKSGDLLLDRLGVQQYLSEDLASRGPSEEDAESAEPRPEKRPVEPAGDADSDVEQAEAEAEENDYPALTRLYLENERAPAYIGFDTDYHLFDSKNLAYAWANSADATHMLQIQQGDGLVTVLTDNWIWQNHKFDRYDNAWLLWYLTQDSAVTLVYRADSDSLFVLLARYFPEALAGLALLVLLVLWRAGLRHGPLLAAPDRARRQLEEHLRAGADFLLRQNGHAALLQRLQRDILRRARQRQPGFERLPVAEQWQVLGRLARMPSSAVGQAMRPCTTKRLSAAEFTRQVAHLQSLRNSL